MYTVPFFCAAHRFHAALLVVFCILHTLCAAADDEGTGTQGQWYGRSKRCTAQDRENNGGRIDFFRIADAGAVSLRQATGCKKLHLGGRKHARKKDAPKKEECRHAKRLARIGYIGHQLRFLAGKDRRRGGRETGRIRAGDGKEPGTEKGRRRTGSEKKERRDGKAAGTEKRREGKAAGTKKGWGRKREGDGKETEKDRRREGKGTGEQSAGAEHEGSVRRKKKGLRRKRGGAGPKRNGMFFSYYTQSGGRQRTISRREPSAGTKRRFFTPAGRKISSAFLISISPPS